MHQKGFAGTPVLSTMLSPVPLFVPINLVTTLCLDYHTIHAVAIFHLQMCVCNLSPIACHASLLGKEGRASVLPASTTVQDVITHFETNGSMTSSS